MIEPFTTKPSTSLTPVVFTVGTDVLPLTTPGGSGKSAVPSVGGREAQTGRGMPTGTMVGVIVVTVAVILVAALIAVFFVRRKRYNLAYFSFILVSLQNSYYIHLFMYWIFIN